MNESEVIIVDGIPNTDYDQLIEKCVKYSLISLPFTVDRMKIPDDVTRALNITKGKIAETIFEYFCIKNDIEINFKDCTTPFWTIDKRDFLLNGGEWDIKTNFYYCQDSELNNYDYIDLPALVPNRFEGDQWSKRDTVEIQGSQFIAFLFTFLKMADLIENRRGEEFIQIILTDEQKKLVRELYEKYKGLPQDIEPFTEDWFWDEMSKRGPNTFYKLRFRPSLVITGYANKLHWDLFKNTGPYDRNNNYQTYKVPRWYTKSSTGACNFLNGTLWTKITNATTPVSKLPSFLSLFPNLNENIKNARIKTIA